MNDAECSREADLVARLLEAGCVAAEDEAGELIGAASSDDALEELVLRREAGEPLAWITGSLHFCGHRILVHPGVYVPRHQTEELARRAAAVLPTKEGRAADLCAGSGAIAVHLAAEVPGVTLVAVDIDPIAVGCAHANGVPAIRADVAAPPLRPASFDVVTAVAPYVPTADIRFLPADVQRYEPLRALDGGPDGLHLHRRVVASAGGLLRAEGWLLVELGGDQDSALLPHLARAGFAIPVTWHDEYGDLRGLAAQRTRASGF